MSEMKREIDREWEKEKAPEKKTKQLIFAIDNDEFVLMPVPMSVFQLRVWKTDDF